MLTARVDTGHIVSAVFMGPSAAAACCCYCLLLLLLLLLHDACCRYRVSMDTTALRSWSTSLQQVERLTGIDATTSQTLGLKSILSINKSISFGSLPW